MGDHVRTMFEVVEEALRKVAFAFVTEAGLEPDEAQGAAAEQDEPEFLGARIDFVGPARGHIVLTAPGRLVTFLTANMLAQDEDSPEVAEHRTDALGELLNMICGRLLPRIWPHAPSFQIGMPYGVTPCLPAPAAEPACGGRWLLDILVEGLPVRFMMELDKGAGGG